MPSTRPTRLIALFALLLPGAATLGGCAPRAVEVRTAVDRPEVTLALANDTDRAVNVYVVVGGTELFLRQVAARSTVALPVRGVTSGSTVTLRAVSMDGRKRYEQPGVVATGTVRWALP